MRLATPIAAALGCMIFSLAEPGMAQSGGPPPLRPKQDVALTYRHPGALPPGVPELQTRTFIATSSQRQRFENAGLVVIIDPQAKRRYMFISNHQDPASGIVTEQDTGDEMSLDEIAADPDFQVTRLDEARFGDIGCQLWRVALSQMPDHEAQTICVAQDGLQLMSEVTRQGVTERTEVVRVEYGTLDPALFALPEGWPVLRQGTGMMPR